MADESQLEEKVARRSWDLHFLEDIDVGQANIPLTVYCGITGYVTAVVFTACYIWPAFQTGNTVQLGIALARTFSAGEQSYEPHNFHVTDRQALVSLATFNLGCHLARFSPWDYKTKAFVVASTVVQALLTMAGALTIHYSGQSSFGTDRSQPSWTNALGFLTIAFISASMGAQGTVGNKLGSQFATTVVLTSLFCQLGTEPSLLQPRAFTKMIPARDNKIVAILLLFIGGIIARALVGQIGAAGTLGIGAGLRVISALVWCLAKTTPKEKRPDVKVG